MKNKYNLAESKLRNIIQESVKEILKESYYGGYVDMSWEDMNDPDFWYDVASEIYTIDEYDDEIERACNERIDEERLEMFYRENIENFVKNMNPKKYVRLEVDEDAVREDLDRLFQTDVYSY